MIPTQTDQPVNRETGGTRSATQQLTCSVADAARTLGIGRDACYRLIRDGRLKTIRMGPGRIRVPRAELEAFLDREAR
jgi:excisionase family DNA binding protein